MSDSESDLTEFEDEDDVPLSSQRSKGKKRTKDSDDDEGGYRIRGALRVPRVANYTTQSLHDQIMAGDINLDPDYQRDVVWPENKQIGLIDSLFRNFYVPPVIFVVDSKEDGSEHRTCVDGKQRLTSINRFLQGQIPYKDHDTNEKFYFQLIGKPKGKLLPERYRKVFKNKQIVCIEYEGLNADSEREIFQRVQLGMALTPAEKLQAVDSPRATFVRELVGQYITERLGVFLELETARGGDFRFLGLASMALDVWDEKKEIPANIETWIKKNVKVSDKLVDNAHHVLSIFAHLTEEANLKPAFEIRDAKGKLKKVAPMEFVAICVMIYHTMKRLSFSQIAEAIRLMRADVRGKEKDIRTNTRTAKLLSDFVKKYKVKKQLAKDASKPTALEAIKKPGTTKRKRSRRSPSESEEEEDELDEEEAVAPVKKTRRAVPATKPPSKVASPSSPAAPKPSLSLPRGPTVSQAPAPAPAPVPPTTDPRRRDVVPKAEPSPTPAPAGPPLASQAPPPPPPPTWPVPYPAQHGQTPTPSPNPNAWMSTQSLLTSSRLAAVHAAKEQASLPSTPTQQWPGALGRMFPFTPPASQPSMQPLQPTSAQGALLDLMARAAAGNGGFGNPDFTQGYGGHPPQQNGGFGRG